MSTRGRMLEKIFNRYNLLCLNEKEKTYYRAFDGCKLTIDLTLANLMIAPKYKWSKEVIISPLSLKMKGKSPLNKIRDGT